MNKNTLLILLGIFVTLSIAASSPWWEKYLNIGKKSSSNNIELDLSTFNKNVTDKISITKNEEEEKIITKQNNLWKINDFDASQEEIDNFFETLQSLKVKSLVSKNPDNYKNFGVTDKDGFILTLTSNNNDTIFIIGKQGTTFNSFYAKTKESNNVYEVLGDLRDKLSQSITTWRNKTIVTIPQESIQKIEIASKDNPLTIIKNQNTWNAEKSGQTATLDEPTTTRLLSALNPLEASGFLNEKEQQEFQDAKEKTIIRVFGNDGETIAEITLLEKKNEWWAQVTGKEIFYKIPTYKLSDILLIDEKIVTKNTK